MRHLTPLLFASFLIGSSGPVIAQQGASSPAAPAPAQPAAPPAPAPATAPKPSGAPVTAAPPAPVAEDYKLELGDKLRIEVYKEEQFSQSVQIRPDGKITMPMIGDLVARGLTSRELAERLTGALKEVVNRPLVDVIVVEATPPIAYIMGEVNKPGEIVVKSGMTVLQAIAVSGGLKDFADSKNIRILRKGQTIPFDYKGAMKGGGAPVYLMPGDTVIVPD